MRTDDAILILLDWRQGEETASVADLLGELAAVSMGVDQSTVHRVIQRLRESGLVTCPGHEHVQGRYLTRMYRLTRSGRRDARRRKESIQKLLDTPPEDLLEDAS